MCWLWCMWFKWLWLFKWFKFKLKCEWLFKWFKLCDEWMLSVWLRCVKLILLFGFVANSIGFERWNCKMLPLLWPLLLSIAPAPLVELLFSALVLVESSLIRLLFDWVKEDATMFGLALAPLLLAYNWPKSFSLLATELRLVAAGIGVKLYALFKQFKSFVNWLLNVCWLNSVDDWAFGNRLDESFDWAERDEEDEWVDDGDKFKLVLPKCSLDDSCLPFAFDWCFVLTLVFNDELFESEYELMLLFISDLLVRCLLRTILS